MNSHEDLQFHRHFGRAVPSRSRLPADPVRGRSRSFHAPVLLAFGAAAALSGCHRTGSPAAAAADLPPAKVRVATVSVQDLPELTEVPGTVSAVRHAQLAAKVMGAITDIPFGLGQRVHAGDLLVRISAAEISARVVQAESQLNAARRDLDRERDLLAKGASTPDLVKGLQDRFDASRAMVNEANAMLGYTMVRAPFDGVVSRKFVNVGDLASPGIPLLAIEGTSGFEVEAAVPDILAGRLATGMKLDVAVPDAGAVFSGELAELAPAADPSAHTVLAKIGIPASESVRSGEFARVRIPGTKVPMLLAPISAVARYGQMQLVFVAGEGDRATLRLVKTGARHAAGVEILAGLDSGERVVLDPPAGLREGAPLEIGP